MQDISLVKLGSSYLHLHPEAELLSLFQGQLVPPKKYTQRFQGKVPSWGFRIVFCVPNGLFCIIVHLSVELCAACKAFITSVVILVGLDVGEDSGKG
jgi:hypothetical protein